MAFCRYGVPVVGTLGLLASAAERGWLDLPQVLETLRQTNIRLDPALLKALLERRG
ncbi:MAG: DUF3368 domain-containing protein [Nevskiaceae bacterium]|jgi:predicted nucleic acid-binding protein|nr:DUF3368 domain-containing protein [Nevskiaceae bacterium]